MKITFPIVALALLTTPAFADDYQKNNHYIIGCKIYDQYPTAWQLGEINKQRREYHVPPTPPTYYIILAPLCGGSTNTSYISLSEEPALISPEEAAAIEAIQHAPPAHQQPWTVPAQDSIPAKIASPVTAPIPLTPQTSNSSDNKDVVPITYRPNWGTYVVDGLINGRIQTTFTVDSGAASVVIPRDLFNEWQHSGAITTEDLGSNAHTQLADGSISGTTNLTLRRIQIGQHVAHNVQAIIVKGGSPLLGQTFLSNFRWTFDPVNKQLILD